MQRNRHLYRLLHDPRVYALYERLLGADRARGELARVHLAGLAGDDAVLDIGCGTGSIYPFLADSRYTGVDNNARAVAFARRRFPGPGQFVVADALAFLATTPARYRLIFAGGFLHHLADAPLAEFLALARGRLLPGGRLVTHDPALTPGQHPLARLLARLDRGGNVKTAEDYRRAALAAFPQVEVSVYHGLLRLPATICVMECRHDE